MTTGQYLDTPKGKVGRYRWRRRGRLHLEILNIEPRGKNNMPGADQERFQKQVLKQLTKWTRYAFRGPIVLQMSISTTEKTPSHVHTIAKNLLDILSKPRPGLCTSRRGLLYLDDVQVHGLSVSAQHGESAPRIFLTALPLRFLLADLDLAVHAQTELRDQDDTELSDSREDDIEEFRDFLQNRTKHREYLSEKAYNSFLDFLRRKAQQHLLGASRISLANLGYLFNVAGMPLSNKDPMWKDTFTRRGNQCFATRHSAYFCRNCPRRKALLTFTSKKWKEGFAVFRRIFHGS